MQVLPTARQLFNILNMNLSYIDGSRAVVVWILAKVLKNVNVTTIMFLMSGDLTGLCLYIHVALKAIAV